MTKTKVAWHRYVARLCFLYFASFFFLSLPSPINANGDTRGGEFCLVWCLSVTRGNAIKSQAGVKDGLIEWNVALPSWNFPAWRHLQRLYTTPSLLWRCMMIRLWQGIFQNIDIHWDKLGLEVIGRLHQILTVRHFLLLRLLLLGKTGGTLIVLLWQPRSEMC